MYRRSGILLFACLLILGSCKQKGEDSIYVIPNGYKGNAIIIFGCAKGSEVQYENGKRFYKFDSTGILKTKFAPNGQQRLTFYLEDKNGKRILANYDVNPRQGSADITSIFYHQAGSFFDEIESKQKHFEVFTIASPKEYSEIINTRTYFCF